ncbi:MAG: PTS N-acetylglucosamine transporter subunit IIBC [Streptococcaceae bacterium]|jgi:PTS system mannose-specific IIA component|nr:PTS N-acetylglucosamine transporter subunit IIBC [Streptococcaceae bacterium]
MNRKFIIASHSTLAQGMTAALKFFVGEQQEIIELNAYLNNEPIINEVKAIFEKLSVDDEAIVLTDLLAGSVNQTFYPYVNRAHTHIFTGMNMALGLALLLEPRENYLTQARARLLLSEARENLVYMNDFQAEVNEEDE